MLAALVCLGGFEGGSKIGDRRSYSIAAIACLFGTAARLAFDFFARSIKSILSNASIQASPWSDQVGCARTRSLTPWMPAAVSARSFPDEFHYSAQCDDDMSFAVLEDHPAKRLTRSGPQRAAGLVTLGNRYSEIGADAFYRAHAACLSPVLQSGVSARSRNCNAKQPYRTLGSMILDRAFVGNVQYGAAGLAMHSIAIMALQAAGWTSESNLARSQKCPGEIEEQGDAKNHNDNGN